MRPTSTRLWKIADGRGPKKESVESGGTGLRRLRSFRAGGGQIWRPLVARLFWSLHETWEAGRATRRKISPRCHPLHPPGLVSWHPRSQIDFNFQQIFNAKKKNWIGLRLLSCFFEAEILEFQRLNRAGFQVYVRYLKLYSVFRSSCCFRLNRKQGVHFQPFQARKRR